MTFSPDADDSAAMFAFIDRLPETIRGRVVGLYLTSLARDAGLIAQALARQQLGRRWAAADAIVVFQRDQPAVEALRRARPGAADGAGADAGDARPAAGAAQLAPARASGATCC